MPRQFAVFGSITYNESLGTTSTPNREGDLYPEYGTPKYDTSYDPGQGWNVPLLPITWDYAADTEYDTSYDPGQDWNVPLLPITWTYAADKQMDESYVLISEGGTWPSGSFIP